MSSKIAFYSHQLKIEKRLVTNNAWMMFNASALYKLLKFLFATSVLFSLPATNVTQYRRTLPLG